MNSKVVVKCFISSIFILVSLSFVLYVNRSIQYRFDEINRLNQGISTARSNLARLNTLLTFKKKFKGNISIRVEPVKITAEFPAVSSKKKIDEIVNTTYKKDGLFFLGDFKLGNAKNACFVKLSLEGSKVVIFGLPQ